MIFKDESEVIELIKSNQRVSEHIQLARNYTSELLALVDGEKFNDTLTQIENIESNKLYSPRKKRARDVKHLVSRVVNPTYNIFSARGGTKNYQYKKRTEEELKTILNIVSNNKDGKSLERYLEEKWVGLYHSDPAGVMWIRYEIGENIKCYPTYQDIFHVRNYKPKGQLVEWIVFEPTRVKYGEKEIEKWIVVDDLKQYTIYKDVDRYWLSQEPLETFEHPFGEVPVIINSDLTDRHGNRISPLHKIVPVLKEYAEDQSVKTLYKRTVGFPKSWVITPECKTCEGHRKVEGKECASCKGYGYAIQKDVNDVLRIPLTEAIQGNIKGADMMGHHSPDLEYLRWANEELDRLEGDCYYTRWGILSMNKIDGSAKTATEIMVDKQPQINELNKLSNVAEWIEWKHSEWVVNLVCPLKEKKEQATLIVYPRKYILDGIDSLQQAYEKAKENGDSSVILDDKFEDLISTKYKNDVEFLRYALIKSKVEPYLHYNIDEIFKVHGQKEAAKKMYFGKWWALLKEEEKKKEPSVLIEMLNNDFNKQYLGAENKTDNPIENQLGKIPLALQQLKNSRDGAIAAGDKQLADALGNKMDELLNSI